MSNAMKKPKLEEDASSTLSRTSSTIIPANPTRPQFSEREEDILAYIDQNPGCDGKSIHIGTDCPEKEMAVFLQRLLKLGEILVFEDANNDITFKIGNTLSRRVASLPSDAKAVYSAVEAAGNMGIWHRMIKTKTNMEQQRITRAIKMLMANKFIKEFCPVNASKKKYYMLYHLQPSTEVDGGTFYDKGVFDGDLVDAVRNVVFKFLDAKYKKASKEFTTPLAIYKSSYASVAEVAHWIKEKRIFLVKFSEVDMKEIFSTLIHENKIVAHPSKEGSYRVSLIAMPTTGVATTPCGQCPVRNKCATDGVISPTSCEYMAKWLDF